MTDSIYATSLGRASDLGQVSTRTVAANPPAFAECLEAARQVHFSNHAQKRLDTRNIEMDSERQLQLADAVDRAAARGGKESLVLMDDLALIVNVADRLVITAMDDASQKGGVFTKIDSVVLAYKK